MSFCSIKSMILTLRAELTHSLGSKKESAVADVPAIFQSIHDSQHIEVPTSHHSTVLVIMPLPYAPLATVHLKHWPWLRNDRLSRR